MGDNRMSFYLEEKIREMESILETGWEFFVKPYTDEDVLKQLGKVTIDGEDIQITNHVMETVVQLIATAQKTMKQHEKDINDLRHDLRIARQECTKAREYAAMSDARIADELDKGIEWFNVNSGQEDLVWGPVELMGYCRDRLRSRT